MRWDAFEQECTDYLNGMYNQYASFTHMGASNSNVSDILVDTGTQTFYIEVKHSPAQSGQFVLSCDAQHRSFVYGKNNADALNKPALDIIEHMNDDYERFAHVSTTSISIEFDGCHDIFVGWIVSHYRHKNVKFVMSNGHVIVPLTDIGSAFDIAATYRRKRSGSSSIQRSSFDNKALSEFLQGRFGIKDIAYDGDKTFVTSRFVLSGKRFALDETGRSYIFSKKGKRYEVRRLSKTSNANVIFRLALRTDARSNTNALMNELRR